MAGWDDLSPFAMPLDARPDLWGRTDELGRPLMTGQGGRVYTLPMPNALAPAARPMQGPDVPPFLPDGTPNPAYADSPAGVYASRNADMPGNALAGMVGAAMQGVSAPSRAAQGDAVTLGDTYATAGSAMGGGAFGSVPQGALAANSFRSYHGSPHQFDRFSMDAIGTGEGAQAYGHGLYFADSEGVARGYRDGLSDGVSFRGRPVLANQQGGGDPTLTAGQTIGRHMASGADFLTAQRQTAREFRFIAARARRDGVPWGSATPDATERFAAGYDEMAEIVRGLPESDFSLNAGSMYEVEINADPANFLDYDAPLSQQSSPVRDALLGQNGLVPQMLSRPASRELMQDWHGGLPVESTTGGGLLDALESLARAREMTPNGPGVADAVRGRNLDRAASAFLNNEGIPGIRYLDQGSRAAADGTRNTVVFDDRLISILRRYSVGSAAPIGAALAAGAITAEEAAALQAQTGGS